MSKKSQSKLVNCLMCQKKTECVKNARFANFINYFFEGVVAEVEQDTYMVIDCPCFAIYDEDDEILGISKQFVKDHGDA
jgi:hypothetical protein